MIGCWTDVLSLLETRPYETAAWRIRASRVDRSRLVDRPARAEQGREEAGRRTEKGNPEHRQDRGRCSGGTGRRERLVAHLAARRRAEGAGQQGIRAVHDQRRSVEGDGRQGGVLLAGCREGRGNT